MGQYYKPILIAEDGHVCTACSHDFDNGLKLMEHSWIGNNFVNVILAQIRSNPKRIVWMGDYAIDVIEDTCDFGNGFVRGKNEFEAYYNRERKDGVYKDTENLTASEKPYLLDEDHADCYIVNITRREYLDMRRYMQENTGADKWCINPLPILTSVGNGAGGGDYWGINMDDVGIWAFDELYVSELCPSQLTEVTFSFKE